MSTRNPSTPESQYQHLLNCYRSGQIEESAWQKHLQDTGFREWVEAHTEPHEQLCHRLKEPLESEWTYDPDKEAAVEQITSDTALIGELVEAIEGLLSSPQIADADIADPEWGCPETAAAEDKARALITRARKRTVGA